MEKEPITTKCKTIKTIITRQWNDSKKEWVTIRSIPPGQDVLVYMRGDLSPVYGSNYQCKEFPALWWDEFEVCK